MGTSGTYGGPGGGTPLVPSWLDSDDDNVAPPPSDAPPTDGDNQDDARPPDPTLSPPIQSPVPVAASDRRFAAARNSFTRFAGSGGRDLTSLRRSVLHYVSTASGGPRQAAQRMGTSRTAGSRLLSFLSSAVANSAREALRALNLEGLAGRPIEEVFVGLTDYVCPYSGTVDEGIAREAFIETIADLAENGITNLDAMNADQMQTIFEIYASHAIESRLCNDIGMKAVTLPADTRTAASVQAQLYDFIRRSVADALTVERASINALTPDRVLSFVTHVYEQAFGLLQGLSVAEVR